MARYKNLLGIKFGNLEVVSFQGINKHGGATWLCICDCGNSTIVDTNSLTSGHTKSCSCLHNKHNLAGAPIYNSWCNMKSRCENPQNDCYHHYGGRGIKICDKWQTFKGFYDDMGLSYKEGLTIERVDTNGDYRKDNCRWATMQEQSQNKRSNRVFTVDGRTDILKNLCEIYNINYHTAYGRMLKGLPIDVILKSPLQCGIKFEKGA